MKVQCGQCPAKYAVSDERVKDRKVRIHCKRCGASIIVDGKVDPPLITSTPARPSVRPAVHAAPMPENQPPAAPEPDPDSQPSPRPVAHTIMGGLEAPAAERLEQQRSSPPPRPMRSPASPHPASEEDAMAAGMPAEQHGMGELPAAAEDTRWRVALTRQDLRWMTTEEIVLAFRSGAVKPETFVFRAGMPTWVTLPEVPEIAAALADAGGSSVSSRPPPRRVARPGDANALAELAALDASEPMPFALVAQRSNGAMAAVRDAERGHAPLPPEAAEAPPAESHEAPGPHARAERPSIETVPAESLSQVPDEPVAPPLAFAAAQQASASSTWIWLVVALLLLAAVGAYLATRQG